MTEEHRGVIEQNAADMAARGMRVLALGFREVLIHFKPFVFVPNLGVAGKFRY